MTPVHCCLVGGPFDGDEARVLGPAPESIWAFACPGLHAAGKACSQGGVHWCFDEARMDRVVEMTGVVTERYVYERVVAGSLAYVWAGLTVGGPVSAREEATA